MPALRFLVTFAVTAFAAAAAVVGLNCVIDPLGVVPASPSLHGLNAEKVMRFNNDRIYKPLDLLSVRPRTVVLGTSRILQAFDPRTFSGTPYSPAYNYGFPGGNLNEMATHFERFIARMPSVRYVFVELFLPMAQAERPTRSTPELLAAAFLSSSALQLSADTVWQNLRIRTGRGVAGPVALHDGRQSFVVMAPMPNFLAYPAAFLRRPPRYEVDPVALGAMRRMREVAHSKGIALTFFISPVHAVQLYTLHTTNHWPILEDWKRALAREFNVLDFSAYSSITGEPVSSEMRYWKDPHHFSPLTASILAERLVRQGVGMVDGFGSPLTSDRLEDELRIWREARDRWIA
ncbi:MAG: hypothetical protein ACRDIB_13920, partial [Ardenticatenaceae bacterium]